MKRKKISWVKAVRIICITLIICIGLPLITCVSFGCGLLAQDIEQCVSVTLFENHEVLLVTKMVLRKDGQSDIVIKNPILIRRVTAATTAPNRLNMCEGCVFEGGSAWIDLYSGKRLIRSVEWSPKQGVVKLFDEPDSTHIVAHPLGEKVSGGYVQLFFALGDRLRSIAEKNW